MFLPSLLIFLGVEFIIIFWVFVINPLITTEAFAQIVPPLQFLISNLSVILLLTLFAGLPYLLFQRQNHQITLERQRKQVKETAEEHQHLSRLLFSIFKSGFATFIIYSFVGIMIIPPLFINKEGLFLGNNNPNMLPETTPDMTAAWFWGLFNIQGYALYLMVYIGTPTLANFIAFLILKGRALAQIIGLDLPKEAREEEEIT